MEDLKFISKKDLKNSSLSEIISYRKSGLSLNHIVGCPLDCAYCVRHFFDNFDMKVPKMICTDEEAVELLVSHKFFIPDVTPIQIFNRATDPFLSNVKGHTHCVLKMLDERGFKNPVLIITRANVTQKDVMDLEKLNNLKLSILVTYSGIKNTKIEPIAKNKITTRTIETISSNKKKIKLVLYWRPIVMGWNDDDESFERVFDMAKLVDAVVYTGYYHRPENYSHIRNIGLDVPYDGFARRKYFPSELEDRILAAYQASGVSIPLFRKTSCGVTFAHNIPDYNGHWGVNELCDICPQGQKSLCEKSYNQPTRIEFENLLNLYDYDTPFKIEDGHIWTEGLGEEKRYHLQHTLSYQIWDIDKPHFKDQHGRSPFGQIENKEENDDYKEFKKTFFNAIIENDD